MMCVRPIRRCVRRSELNDSFALVGSCLEAILDQSSGYLNVLDAQRSVFTVQQLLVKTRLAQLQRQVTLHKTLDGGCKTRSPRREVAGC